MELRAWREMPVESRERVEAIMGSPTPGLYRILGRYLEKAEKPYRAEAVRFLLNAVAPNAQDVEPQRVTEPTVHVAKRGRPRKAA